MVTLNILLRMVSFFMISSSLWVEEHHGTLRTDVFLSGVVLQNVLFQMFFLLVFTSFAMGTQEFALSGTVLMSFDVNFQSPFSLELFAANVTNMGGRGAVFILVVFFQSCGIGEVFVAKFAIRVFSVFHEYVFCQSLLAIKLLITMFTSVGWLKIWVVFPFVFVNVENVTIQGPRTIAFGFTVRTLFLIKNTSYACR